MYRIERGYGKFQRTLRVPKGLDADAGTASIADGVLTIHVPMPEARKPHRIKTADGSHAAIESGPEWEELEAAASGSSDVQEPALAGAAACSEGLVRRGETPIDHSIAGHTEFIQYLRQVSEQAVAKV